jgi:hypothetical protein
MFGFDRRSPLLFGASMSELLGASFPGTGRTFRDLTSSGRGTGRTSREPTPSGRSSGRTLRSPVSTGRGDGGTTEVSASSRPRPGRTTVRHESSRPEPGRMACRQESPRRRGGRMCRSTDWSSPHSGRTSEYRPRALLDDHSCSLEPIPSSRLTGRTPGAVRRPPLLPATRFPGPPRPPLDSPP